MPADFILENPEVAQSRKRRARVVMSCDYWCVDLCLSQHCDIAEQSVRQSNQEDQMCAEGRTGKM